MTWISLIVLGLILVFIVRQSAARVSQTPWWLLWLVLMLPAFFIGGWMLLLGNTPVPSGWLILVFVTSSVLYLVLLRRGQPSLPAAPPTPPPPTPTENGKLLNQDEETQLQSCFPWGMYYLQQIEYRPQAVICRGQMRGDANQVYETVERNIAQRFGDRFLVMFQMGLSNKPFFALIPRDRLPQPQQLFRPGLSLGLLALTFLTTTVAGLALVAPDLTAAELRLNPSLLWQGLPYSVSLLLILGIHELGHFATAWYYRVKATLPYFIPLPFAMGTLGAFIQMRSPVPHRRALFDISMAGPLAGLLVTLPILVWGLQQSEVVQLPANASEQPLNPQVFSPRISLLFALIAKAIFGAALKSDSALHLHPMAVAGVLGLVVTALNLMPVGQLDGGHIVHAMYGHRAGAVIGQVSRLLVLILSFIQPWLFVWALILFFMPAFDEPALNDVSELDNWRDALGLMALVLLLLIILPVPAPLGDLLLPTHPMP
ncbi:site-2 protease family protein [Thermosynechococcus sp. QKsg1]|uniref:site-2 protease family protein n=1 Tax=unclassified Thermosynechococcus TaxID=2622553 RepID=UPI0025759057|nr:MULTISPECIES: site-2 protease family protein [unclassified Thermosynechococcus]WJI24414.1 site-2 protease family protein [Thermosynechococcus sp. B0]WJI26935.1 site-2 protease family protein [Thermosynechococcus sp. B1]WJI29466.1 site-2 protease family protein [Thermosynechococcus sp. B3]WNC87054.1 site-2 protease family protein [Thermosynechococcus sp. QKsg1]